MMTQTKKIDETHLTDVDKLIFNDICEFDITDICDEKIEDANDATITKVITKFTGKAQVADKKNHNNRIYPLKVLEKAVADIQPAIKRGTVSAQLGHPTMFKSANFDTAVAILTAAYITDGVVTIEGNFIKNKATEDLFAYKAAGGRLGLSVRAYGGGKYDEKKKAVIFGDDYTIKGWDFVTDPAVLNARATKFDEKDKGNLHNNKEEKGMEIKTLQDLRHHYPEFIGILDKEHNDGMAKAGLEIKDTKNELEISTTELKKVQDSVVDLTAKLETVSDEKVKINEELAKVKFDAGVADLMKGHKYSDYIEIPSDVTNIEDATTFVTNETKKLDAFKAVIVKDSKVDDSNLDPETPAKPEEKIDDKGKTITAFDAWTDAAFEMGRMA